MTAAGDEPGARLAPAVAVPRSGCMRHSEGRRSRASARRRAAAAGAVGLLAVLDRARCIEAQMTTSAAPTLFGTKYVLQRFRDSQCRNLDTGQGTVQSWTHISGATGCYELTAGFLCDFMCIYKLECQFETGSGVTIKTMPDKSCTGSGADPRPFAQHLYWKQAEGLFNGDACVSNGAGKWLKFSKPLSSTDGYPDCSSQGDVAPGLDDSSLRFEAEYELEFFNDTECNNPYIVSKFSDRQTSSFTFKLQRGAQHCYDMVDSTPRGNNSFRAIDYSMRNWRFVCGNIDMVGNGIMIEGFSAPQCQGGSLGQQRWKTVFYPMNFPDTMDLLRGRCVRWGKFSAKFTSAWNPLHFPDCADWACDAGRPCTGGRVTDPSNTVGTMYTGAIRTSGGDPAWPLSSGNQSISADSRRGATALAPAAALAAAAAAAAGVVRSG